MSVKKPALGRGLEALFSPTASAVPITAFESPSLRQVPIDEIHPNPYQPRSDFDPEKLRELADSIKAKGILQPIVLRRAGTGYQIVAGERRWRAAHQAGLERVPAIIRDFDDAEMMQAALIENIQRDDLNPVEEATAYQRLIEKFNLTQEVVAEALGKSRVAITNALRLLKLPREILDLIVQDKLSAGHGRALLALESPARQVWAARHAIEKSLSVREIEALVRTKAEENGNAENRPQVQDDVGELQERLSQRLGLRVRLAPKTNTTGKVEIYYTSLDEFQHLCGQLGLPLSQTL